MKRSLLMLLIGLTLSLSAELKLTKICRPSITAESYVITEPGKYILCNSFTYTGSGAAIQIASSNVELCLFARNITLTGTGTGILINNPAERICEISVNNDSISGTTDSLGIVIDNACKIRLHNMFTIGHTVGFVSFNASDICVDRCQFTDATFGTFSIESDSITCTDCTFRNNVFFNAIFQGCLNTSLFNCSFLDTGQVHLSLDTQSGSLVKNCTFSNSESQPATSIDLQRSSNARFECCTFEGVTAANQGDFNCFDSINCIIDSCLFDTVNQPDNLHATIFDANSSNSKIRGCTLKGSFSGDPQDTSFRIGCLLQDSHTLENSTISNVDIGAVIIGAGNTVRNCTISNTDTGIVTNSDTSNNLIKDCNFSSQRSFGVELRGTLQSVISNVITNYGLIGILMLDDTLTFIDTQHTIFDNDVIGSEIATDGIKVQGSSGENGMGPQNNRIDKNRVHHNSTFGIFDETASFPIVDDESTNQVFHNTVFNSGTNYRITPAPDSGPVVTPGLDTLEGENISA